MKTRAYLGLGLATLMLGGATLGGAGRVGVAVAGTKDAAGAERQAARDAERASSALVRGDAAKAVRYAEAAVALSPASGAYRTTLGQAYLKAGRFTSARQALVDALALSPGDGRAALNLALAQIGEGQWAEARQLLEANSTTIPAADRGLAIALAGDPVTAVDILATATRSPDADTKTRQNLALTLALAGRWQEARAVAAIDLSPADVDKRLLQWASFAQPSSASDQVAALLGVVPIKDAGQPVALALADTIPVELAEASPASGPAIEAYMPGQAEAPVAMAAVASSVPPSAAPAFQMAERREVVQPLPAPAAAMARIVPTIAASGSYKTRVAGAMAVATPRAAPAKGNWYVQLGAFENAAVAKDGWSRAKRRHAAFAAHTPAGMAFASRVGTVYRLSLGGFQRADADAMCRTYRGKGGACFVRAGAGDQIAKWVRPTAPIQVAAR